MSAEVGKGLKGTVCWREVENGKGKYYGVTLFGLRFGVFMTELVFLHIIDDAPYKGVPNDIWKFSHGDTSEPLARYFYPRMTVAGSCALFLSQSHRRIPPAEPDVRSESERHFHAYFEPEVGEP